MYICMFWKYFDKYIDCYTYMYMYNLTIYKWFKSAD